MPTLYRCRTALSEVAQLFDAKPPEHADWSAELWPNRTGFIIRQDEDGRHIEAMRWSLPPALGQVEREIVTALWFRQWFALDPSLHLPAQRCLIIMDSFALPDGPTGARTRTWYGFEDRPIFAWAGIWRSSGRNVGYCGFDVAAAEPFTGRQVMPALVAPEDYELWLSGAWAPASHIVRRSTPQPDLYCESTEQAWGQDRSP